MRRLINQETNILSARLILICSLLGLCLVNCGTETSNDHSFCNRPEFDCFSSEWRIKGQSFTLHLTEALPSPPERGVNTWSVLLSNLDGSPLDDCQINLTPFMPEHGHGSPLQPIVSSQGEGSYLIKEIAFTMPGLWEMRFDIDCHSELSEQLKYLFWLDR